MNLYPIRIFLLSGTHTSAETTARQIVSSSRMVARGRPRLTCPVILIICSAPIQIPNILIWADDERRLGFYSLRYNVS